MNSCHSNSITSSSAAQLAELKLMASCASDCWKVRVTLIPARAPRTDDSSSTTHLSSSFGYRIQATLRARLLGERGCLSDGRNEQPVLARSELDFAPPARWSKSRRFPHGSMLQPIFRVGSRFSLQREPACRSRNSSIFRGRGGVTLKVPNQLLTPYHCV